MLVVLGGCSRKRSDDSCMLTIVPNHSLQKRKTVYNIPVFVDTCKVMRIKTGGRHCAYFESRRSVHDIRDGFAFFPGDRPWDLHLDRSHPRGRLHPYQLDESTFKDFRKNVYKYLTPTLAKTTELRKKSTTT